MTMSLLDIFLLLYKADFHSHPIVPCFPGDPRIDDRSLEPASLRTFSRRTSKLICWFLPIRKLDNSCLDLCIKGRLRKFESANV